MLKLFDCFQCWSSNITQIPHSSKQQDERIASIIRNASLDSFAKWTSGSIQDNGNTELHLAVLEVLDTQKNLGAIARLLEMGLNPNAQNKDGDTPLHFLGNCRAWKYFHTALVIVLLSYRANPYLANNKGRTPLHELIKGRCDLSSLGKILKSVANPRADIQDNRGNAPLHLLAQGHLNRHDPFDQCVAEMLIKYGAKIDTPNQDENTPLHLAILSRRDKETIEFLLNHQAPVNAQNREGNTPLHTLASLGQCDQEIAELLIEKGANLDMPNEKGELPLHVAYENKSTIIDFLLEKTAVGRLPLHLAAMNSL